MDSFFLLSETSSCSYSSLVLSAALDTMMMEVSDASGSVWRCSVCGHETTRRANLRVHVEAKHLSAGFNCQYCDKFCPSKNALYTHVSRYHHAGRKLP